MRKLPKPIQAFHQSVYSSIREGLQFAISRQELMGSYFVDFMAMVFAMPTALFPSMAEMYGGAKALGLLYAAPAVGSLLIAFFSRWTSNVKSDGKAIAISAGLWGLAMIGFGLSSSLFLALLFLVLSGSFDAISGIFRSSLWNHTIPTEKRGRLAGIEMLSYLSGPRLGDARAGLCASFIGTAATITSGGILCVIAVALCCVCMPRFWDYTSSSNN